MKNLVILMITMFVAINIAAADQKRKQNSKVTTDGALKVKIEGVKPDEGNIVVVFFNEDTTQAPVVMLFPANKTTLDYDVKNTLTRGNYFVSAYHDSNLNYELDSQNEVPLEGVGLFFEGEMNVKVQVTKNDQLLALRISYP